CWRGRRARRQSLEESRTIGTTPTGTRIPSRTCFEVAVVARSNVMERACLGGNTLIQVRIQVAHRLAQRLIAESQQSGPQWRYGAGSSHGEAGSVHLDIIASCRVGIAANIGHAAALEIARVPRGRYIRVRLEGRNREGVAHSAASCSAAGPVVPHHLFGN